MEFLEFLLWKRKTRKELGLHQKSLEDREMHKENVGERAQFINKNNIDKNKSFDVEDMLGLIGNKIDILTDMIKEAIDKISDNKINELITKIDETNKALSDLIAKLGASKTGTHNAELGEFGENNTNVLLTNRLKEVLEIIKPEGVITPSKLAQKLNCSTATSCEFLRRLTKLGKLKLVKRGVYKINEEKTVTESVTQ